MIVKDHGAKFIFILVMLMTMLHDRHHYRTWHLSLIVQTTSIGVQIGIINQIRPQQGSLDKTNAECTLKEINAVKSL